jgi:hypothetical protein
MTLESRAWARPAPAAPLQHAKQLAKPLFLSPLGDKLANPDPQVLELLGFSACL